MYRGFNLNINASQFVGASTIATGKRVFENHRKLVQESLDSFRDADGNLLAERIMAEWFPNLRPHVFISHSHKDSDQAIGLSGWLSEQFGLTAFVDSCAWGYAEKLLKAVDKKHCWDDKTDTYNYQKRNRSTAHVHLMLSNSLMRIVDSSECVFFVNTPNSISTKGFIESSGTTASPWLYTELMVTQVIRRRSIQAHREDEHLIMGGATYDAAMESLEVRYPGNTGHLTDLSTSDLLEWDKKCPTLPSDPRTALDVLYAHKE
ncbi:hypothetical protein [Achromobacter mucicolens]|uniref:hypothetical protein n=1 Tax=Achromobacter mucicolens TaxID=1389922 RepID=UPI001CBCDCDF|nr:hypothetical protein [Achromobacter mucicolens]UAN02018.1 hypothetical protein K9D24_24080 [Achromobacter mucicolens]